MKRILLGSLGLIVLVFGLVATSVSAEDKISNIYAKDIEISRSEASPGQNITGKFTAINASDADVNGFSYNISLLNTDDSVVFGRTNYSSLSVPAHTEKAVDFSYTIPETSGDFTLRLSVTDISGVETGRDEVPFKVTGDSKALSIVSSKVSVGGQLFDLQQGPTISDFDSAYVALEIKNTSGMKVTLNPAVDVYAKSINTQNKVSNYEADSVSIDIGQTASVKIPIESPELADVYEGSISFKSGQNVSVPNVAFRFIKGGDIVTIRNVQVDIASITSNSIPVTIEYTGTPDNFIEKVSGEGFEGSIKVTLVDIDGEIGESVSDVVLGSEGSEDILINFNRSSRGEVSAKIEITNNEGTVVTQGIYPIGSISSPSSNYIGSFGNLIKDNKIISLVIALLLILLIASLVKTSRPAGMVLVVIIIAVGVLIIAFSALLMASAEEGSDPTFISGALGCTYKDLQIVKNTSGVFEVKEVDKYKVPCLASQVYALDICRYATEKKDVAAGKNPFVLGTQAKCSKIDVDSSKRTCTIYATGLKTPKVVSNCVEGIKLADDLTYDTSANCNVYTKVKDVEKVLKFPRCVIIEKPTEANGNICKYYVNKTGAVPAGIKTTQNCTDITEVEKIVETEDVPVDSACTVTTKNPNTGRLTAKNYINCYNAKLEAGKCTFDVRTGRDRITKELLFRPHAEIAYCDKIEAYNYAERMDINFFSPTPGLSGKIEVAPGSNQVLEGTLYYPKCTNQPATANLSIIIVDASGKAIPAARFKSGWSTGVIPNAHYLDIKQGDFRGTFDAPETPGRYSILFTAIGNDTWRGFTLNGRINFEVCAGGVCSGLPNDPNDLGDDSGLCTEDVWRLTDRFENTCTDIDALGNGRRKAIWEKVFDCPTADNGHGDVYGGCRLNADGSVVGTCDIADETGQCLPPKVKLDSDRNNASETGCEFDWEVENASTCTLTRKYSGETGTTEIESFDPRSSTENPISSGTITASGIYTLTCSNGTVEASDTAECKLGDVNPF